ncbi:MAG: hypothetical protein M1321_01300, partial [Candidatus Marsarchaeota archaeon]|nr:hypothetical protein [Candidatus Marsarchaeota archaeon]
MFNAAKGLAQVLSRHSDTRFVIATGGGRLAREAVSAMSAVYDNKYDLDKIAIMPTRLHAMMLMSVISSVKGTEGDVHQAVPVSPDEARSALELKRIVVHGGFIPGMTTDSCAALSAEAMGAKLLVNVSKTNHIYDKDPKGNKDAKPLHRMTYDQLIRLAGESDGRDPGSNFVFDLVAAKL